MSKVPEEMERQMQMFGGGAHFSEKPSDADVYQHDLSHGDVLVFATDGVWDNISPEDMLKTVSGIMVKFQGWVQSVEGDSGVGQNLSALASGKTTFTGARDGNLPGLAAVIASAITQEAKEASLDSRRDGPFAKEVKRHFPHENYRGGKPDDICTVVALVLEDGMSLQQIVPIDRY
jgi:protein phosphatase PTC7